MQKVSFFLSQWSKFMFWTELSDMALVLWHLHMKLGLSNSSVSVRNPKHSLNRVSDPVPKITMSPTTVEEIFLLNHMKGG